MKLELDVNSPQNSLASNYPVSHGFNTEPSDVKNMLRSGIAFAKEGNRAEARQFLLRVTESEPANETAWLWLASISEYPEELLVFLQNVLNINPTNERAIEWAKATKTLLSKTLVQRGINASHENQKEFAKQCYLQAIVHDAENEMAWLWLASAVDSTEEKMSHLQKVLNINPENETALSSLKAVKNQLALALLKKANSAAIAGERQTAHEMLDEIMHQMPELEEAWILKAYLMDNFYSKIDCYEKVLTLNPENEAAQAGLASLKALMQKTSELKSEPVYQTTVLNNQVTDISENNPVDFAADEEILDNAPEPTIEAKEELLETTEESIPEFNEEPVELFFNEEQVELFNEEPVELFNEEPIELLNEFPSAESNDAPSAEFDDAPSAEFEEEVLETAQAEPVAEFSPIAEFSDEVAESFEWQNQSEEKEVVKEFSSENNDEYILMTDTVDDTVGENTDSDFAQSEDENYWIDDTDVPNADLGTSQPTSFGHFHQMDLRQDAPIEPLFSQEIEQTIFQASEAETSVEYPEQVAETSVEYSNNQSSESERFFAELQSNDVDESENFFAEPQSNYQEFSAPVEMPVEMAIEMPVEMPVEMFEIKSFEFAEESNVEELSADSAQSESEMECLSAVPAPNETFAELIQPETFQTSSDSETQSNDSETHSETHFEDVQPSHNTDYQFSDPATYHTIRAGDTIKHDFYNVSNFPTVTNIDASFYHQELEQAKESQTATEEFSYTQTFVENTPVAEQPRFDEELVAEQPRFDEESFAEQPVAQEVVFAEQPVVEEVVFAEKTVVEENYLLRTQSFDFQENLIKKIEEAREASEPQSEATTPVQPEVVIFNCPFCSAENEQHSIICHSCRAMLSLSDLEMMLAHHEADQDVILQAIERLEIEKDLRGFNAEELKDLGIAHLNAKNLRKGYSYLSEASQLDPNDVVLSSKINFLAIRLSEIEEQENKDKENPVVSKTIMVVDDSPTVRKLISGKLEKCGHSVISAIDGMDALAKINEIIPDLVLLDITMPRLDGYQVCKLIRNNEITKDVPIVMISGKDGFFDKVRGRMAGSTGYITKPFGPDTLMKTIETYIN